MRQQMPSRKEISDVLLHCVVDAILGALGLPDIGQIFLDIDPKWKRAASGVFVKEASDGVVVAGSGEVGDEVVKN
ncbi:hypothetical protein RJ640_012502 [Escallonia rubra]|uniref:2-C-methyl-D-erythritol 2,4-cyclodiphosphate synthase domain-containing protein n=1 Tax=Escallonia rubra TaxID=112253 RepID=A0AA88QE23_9ASTE|nr:hypothetical protein RJ640_012502 [Escallonia rubra]